MITSIAFENKSRYYRMQDASPKRPAIWLNANDGHFVLIPSLCMDRVLIPMINFKILKNVDDSDWKLMASDWASLPLTTTIVCVGPSSLSSAAQSSPSVHGHFPLPRFISSSSALSSSSSVPFRRPSCLVVPSVERPVGIQYHIQMDGFYMRRN